MKIVATAFACLAFVSLVSAVVVGVHLYFA